MNQPWLTTSDWPVNAFDSNAAKNGGGFGGIIDRAL
jgi:hypothetical protein